MAFSKYNTNRFKAEPPVKEGEVYDVEILSIGEKGDGFAKVQGFVIVVPGTKKGDKVKVKVRVAVVKEEPKLGGCPNPIML